MSCTNMSDIFSGMFFPCADAFALVEIDKVRLKKIEDVVHINRYGNDYIFY